jgi:uncharacterized protein
MLSFELRALDAKAAHVDGALAADDPVWQESDLRPAGEVRVTGRLSSAGSGKFYFSGRIEGDIEGSCRRCLNDTRQHVSEEAHFLFAEAGEEEAEDPDVFQIDAKAAKLDLRPAIREQWLLSAPAFSLCREDCKGLCPSCGTDLNEATCECAARIDPRWEALRSARANSNS